MWIWRWYSAAARTVTYTNIKGRDPTPNFLHSEQQQIRPIASDRSPPQSRPALLPEFEAGLVAFNDPQRPSVIWSIIQLRGRALKGVVCLIEKTASEQRGDSMAEMIHEWWSVRTPFWWEMERNLWLWDIYVFEARRIHDVSSGRCVGFKSSHEN